MNANTMYSKCFRKIVFRDYTFACKRAEAITKETGTPMYVYWCKCCNHYLLTSSPQQTTITFSKKSWTKYKNKIPIPIGIED